MSVGSFFKKDVPKGFAFLQKAMPWVGALAASAATSNPMPILVQVAQTMSKVSGQEVPPTPQAINQAVNAATPDQLAEYKKIDDDFAVKMQQMGFADKEQLAQITAQDRDSARKMQSATGSRMPGVLAVLAVAAVLVCVGLISVYPTQPSGHDALLMLLGALIAAYKDVYGFFFGSSAGSAEKNEILSQAIQSK